MKQINRQDVVANPIPLVPDFWRHPTSRRKTPTMPRRNQTQARGPRTIFSQVGQETHRTFLGLPQTRVTYLVSSYQIQSIQPRAVSGSLSCKGAITLKQQFPTHLLSNKFGPWLFETVVSTQQRWLDSILPGSAWLKAARVKIKMTVGKMPFLLLKFTIQV